MLSAFAVALALVAAGQPAQGGSVVDPSIEDGSAQRALDAARRTWRAGGPASYSYRLRLACYCTPDSVRPRTFVVRNRRPVHPPKGWRYASTASRLFKLVQKAIDDRVDGLEVEYRPNGLLKTLQVDRIRMAADDEYAYFVDRFRRLRK